jgi:CheY-like chemotaxis protein
MTARTCLRQFVAPCVNSYLSSMLVGVYDLGVDKLTFATIRDHRMGKPKEEKRILLVEDDAMIRESFVSALADEGHEVMTACDGKAALDVLHSGLRPSVIFLDLKMPGMDGQAFRAEQQKDPELANIPVVVLSATAQIGPKADALGVHGHLRKPIDLDALMSLVDRFAGK